MPRPAPPVRTNNTEIIEVNVFSTNVWYAIGVPFCYIPFIRYIWN